MGRGTGEEGRRQPGVSGRTPQTYILTLNTLNKRHLLKVSYSYAFFHTIFALASMYIAMLMTGWGTGAGERELVDVGWASVGVKLGTAALAAGTYAWVLVAPVVFPDRFDA